MKVAIVGAGKLGVKVANALLSGDHSITIFDKNEDKLNKISQQLDVMTVHGNAKQISLLKEYEIGTFDFLLTVTESDEKNIVIASFAKKLGCSKVIARVRDPEHMNQLDFIKETMNIDHIVNPDMAITNEIYKYLVEKYTLTNGIFSTGKVSLIQFKVKRYRSLSGLSMYEIKKELPNMLVVAISRNGKIIIPHGKTIIEPTDTLYLIGERAEIQELHKKVHEKGKYTNLQKVMIVGGGKTGFYLAAKLAEFGVSVKVVEINKERCYYLSTHLDNVMVLHGDATDMSLLEEENLDEMDAFVTATGFDEENLLLALTAKQHGIEDVISKISREGYRDLIEKMGIDMALNPLNITASTILRYIQGEKRVISSLLIQGQAEIMEIIAVSDMKLVNIPLKELDLPEGVLIAGIHRGQQVIIPDGNTRILEDDKVIIFCLLSDIAELEKLFRKKRHFL
ncbi:MAG: Trk system potassium transporter TrkA [Firmicutes bacterium]|nr:Trk system potassium transporter TrkA [Bacillota bacterium]MDD7602804.1 Trk system potassium transporter TrkA [Bacillota bacterium]MDY5855747.1 Trk system potassium transporter TrkA [Anaerovoracaceae bacterium]